MGMAAVRDTGWGIRPPELQPGPERVRALLCLVSVSWGSVSPPSEGRGEEGRNTSSVLILVKLFPFCRQANRGLRIHRASRQLG